MLVVCRVGPRLSVKLGRTVAEGVPNMHIGCKLLLVLKLEGLSGERGRVRDISMPVNIPVGVDEVEEGLVDAIVDAGGGSCSP